MKSIKSKFRKFIAGLAGAVAALVALPAAAQTFDGPKNLTVPASVAAASTNTTYASSNWTASAISGSKMGVGVTFKLTGSGSSTVVLKFDASLDGATWETAAYSVSAAANGTTAVVKNANFDLGALPYVRLSSIENPNASSAVTNLVIRYGNKRGI